MGGGEYNADRRQPMNTLKDYRIIGLCPCQGIRIGLHLGHQNDDGQSSCSCINIPYPCMDLPFFSGGCAHARSPAARNAYRLGRNIQR